MTAAFITAARNVLTPQNLALLVDALAPQWVAAADRLPEPTMEGDVAVWELALIVRESSSIVHVGYYNRYDTKWVSIWGLERIDDVTHWMPLPAKPATMEGGRLDA